MAEIAVLHVVDCLNIGGTERQLFELVRRLDRRRFRPLVACFKGQGELAPHLAAIGIEPMVFPLRGSLVQANTAFQITRMALMCKLHDVRIVHAHDFYSNVIGVAAAQLAGVRSIASRRDLMNWLGAKQRRALRMACRVADAIIANAAAVAAQTEREVGQCDDKIQVVPNGIDTEQFDRIAFEAPDPQLPPLPSGPVAIPRVCMVGSMHLPDKGHADLLQAAAILKGRGVRAQYILVSDGALRPDLEARAGSLGLADDVHFLGRRSDIPSLLVRCDVVALPSWAEGFPNAVLEAMCASRPVVATRVGGIPEVMQEGLHGLLVEPRRPDQLANALERLLRNPLAAHVMGLRGRQRVEQIYSLDRMCATVSALYDQLSGSGAEPSYTAPAAAMA